jgi:energy-coupling factor transport system ATP-binding protein
MLAAHRLTYRPPECGTPLWPPLEVQTGTARFVLLSGLSGAGKSTLLRILCGLLPGFRGGELAGEVHLLGRPAPREPSGRVNLLFQNTDAMLHSPRVADELSARGPAQAGLRPGWLAEIVEQLELGPLLDRRIVELSGGEQQRVALAAVLVGRPPILLLDEPTSNLDPDAAAAFVRLLSSCALRFGTRFLAAEHRPDYLLKLVDGAVHLNGVGSGGWSGTCGNAPRAVLPDPLDLDGLRMSAAASRTAGGELLLSCSRLACRRWGRQVLADIEMQVRAGEVIGLTGPNGAGKSSLLLVLAGALRPTSNSEIRWFDGDRRNRARPRLGLLLQNPLHQLFAETVRQEVSLAADNAGQSPGQRQVDRLLAAADLLPLANRSTLSLSYGEQQRVALAAALSGNPAVMLLDEPTHGMDARRLEQIIRFILEARRRGTAFVVASHDRTLLEAFCDRVLMLRGGQLE